MFVDEAIQLLLPVTPYLVLLLVLAAVWAFRHRATRLGRWRWGVLAALLWSSCMSSPEIGNRIIGSIEAPYPPLPPLADPPASRKPLIVVLTTGSIVKEGDRYRVDLENSGWERVHGGVELWRRIGGELLFVGDPSRDGKASVAAHMATLARAWGVPEGAVRVEEKSRNTYQNLAFTRDLIAAHDGDTWLVTSAIHMRRALAVASKLGLRVRSYPCDHRWRPMSHWYAWLPNAGGPALFTEALHEIIGLRVYRLRGYAD